MRARAHRRVQSRPPGEKPGARAGTSPLHSRRPRPGQHAGAPPVALSRSCDATAQAHEAPLLPALLAPRLRTRAVRRLAQGADPPARTSWIAVHPGGHGVPARSRSAARRSPVPPRATEFEVDARARPRPSVHQPRLPAMGHLDYRRPRRRMRIATTTPSATSGATRLATGFASSARPLRSRPPCSSP
jgi:hypothetical protein